MANVRLIKRKIKSCQNIAQITKAMEMVAASKMKKAQERAVLGKPYAEKIYQLTKELASHTEKKHHRLLAAGKPDGKVLAVLISTNKGLCGSLNTNLFRSINQWLLKNEKVEFISLGKKGENYVVRLGKNLVADFSLKTPFIESVSSVTSLIVDGFIKGIYREVYLCYNTFVSAFRQTATQKMILPISDLNLNVAQTESGFSEFLIEPGVNDVLENLLPHYLENQIRAGILEAEASEHSSRMMAMKNATDNAFDLTQDLSLLYNKARQEKITNEIADIVTARMGMEDE